MNGSKAIAFFDFDGTITHRDTLAAYLIFAKGRFSYYKGLGLLSPMLVAYKAGLINNQRAKEILLAYFLKDMDVSEFNESCSRFNRQVMPSLIRPGAMNQIRNFKERGVEVVVVSASPENWVAPWCSQTGLKCIASVMQVHNGRLTGRLEGFNCHGHEKVNRIRACYDLSLYQQVYAFGDTSGDLPMLELATEKHYRPFRK